MSTDKTTDNTAQMLEEQTRTLYVRLPHTIKNPDEVRELFLGIFRIKLPRQSSRHCHVIFPSVDDKIQNMKNVKTKLVDGKPVFVSEPRPINIDKKKAKNPRRKKIKIPKIKQEPIILKTLFVSHIPLGVKEEEIRDAFPGCVTAGMLRANDKSKYRAAKVKMSTPTLAAQYLSKQIEWPTIKGNKVRIAAVIPKHKKAKTKSKPLKIYDGKNEVTNNKDEVKSKEESDNENDVTTNEVQSEDESDNDKDATSNVEEEQNEEESDS